MTPEELYNSFIKAFPKFEPMIRTYVSRRHGSIQIYTKQNKSFIFQQNGDEFTLIPMNRN